MNIIKMLTILVLNVTVILLNTKNKNTFNRIIICLNIYMKRYFYVYNTDKKYNIISNKRNNIYNTIKN